MLVSHPRLDQNGAVKIAAQNTEKGAKMPHKMPSTASSSEAQAQPCPCGSSLSLAHCCGKYLNGKTPAPTAEALMRSRYTAHVLLNIEYLWRTWSPELRQRSSQEAIHAWASSCEWLGLEILSTQQGLQNDSEGVVEFIAHFRQQNETHQHRETSYFIHTAQGWLYVDHQDAL
jgi:SEC-C motif domain protein